MTEAYTGGVAILHISGHFPGAVNFLCEKVDLFFPAQCLRKWNVRRVNGESGTEDASWTQFIFHPFFFCISAVPKLHSLIHSHGTKMTKRTGAGQLEREKKNKRKVEEYLGRSQIEFESRENTI